MESRQRVACPLPSPRHTDSDQIDSARENIPAAVEALKEVDREALEVFAREAANLEPLSRAIAATVEAGRKVYLCGCGATGRLSISLEVFAREGLFGSGLGGSVIGFMAGGDAAETGHGSGLSPQSYPANRYPNLRL